MKNFVRILAFLLMIGSTVLFVLKVFMQIPITHLQLLIVFAVGVISFFWANYNLDKDQSKKR
ncbi:MAG: hypothetical protein KQH79_02225 [Bacteroidetes bacterium]|nr:hypothetical protein [Bacteroidota bacterium]